MHNLSRRSAHTLWCAQLGAVEAIALLMVATTAGVALGAQVDAAPRSPESLLEMSGQMRLLSQQVAPAVVQILVSGYGLMDSESGRQVSMLGREKSIGSGVIVDPDGYIITNGRRPEFS